MKESFSTFILPRGGLFSARRVSGPSLGGEGLRSTAVTSKRAYAYLNVQRIRPVPINGNSLSLPEGSSGEGYSMAGKRRGEQVKKRV